MAIKSCTLCYVAKELTAFNVDSRTKDRKRTECRECQTRIARDKYRANPSSKNANKTQNNKWARTWVNKNRDKKHAIDKRYRINNAAKLSADYARRKAYKLQAMPSWANQKYIDLWYEHCKLEEVRTGRKCHVDHIVPLKHPLVCGLHNEFNLQVLFAEDNLKKSNRFLI